MSQELSSTTHKKSSDRYTLYHHGSSACAAKVRFALAENGLEWTGVYIDILSGEQFAPEYLAINPHGTVPSLLDGETVILESTVICEYLDLVHPETNLHPTQPLEYANARYWTKAVDEELHPACTAITLICSHRHTMIRKLGGAGFKEFLASNASSAANDWSTRRQAFYRLGFAAPGAVESIKCYDKYLCRMEDALRKSDWLVGTQFSIADVAMAPYVNRLAMMSMESIWEGGRLPLVAAWFERIKERPTFRSSLLDWVPEELTRDLRENGAKSWPEVAKILEIQV